MVTVWWKHTGSFRDGVLPCIASQPKRSLAAVMEGTSPLERIGRIAREDATSGLSTDLVGNRSWTLKCESARP
jgi:hypothetical protein